MPPVAFGHRPRSLPPTSDSPWLAFSCGRRRRHPRNNPRYSLMLFNSGMLLIDGHRLPQADTCWHPPRFLEASPVQTAPVAVHPHRVALPAAPPSPFLKKAAQRSMTVTGPPGHLLTQGSAPRGLCVRGKSMGGWNRGIVCLGLRLLQKCWGGQRD